MISSISLPLVNLYATFEMFLSCVPLPCSMMNSLGLSLMVEMMNSLGLSLMVEGSKVFAGFFSLTGLSSGVVGFESKSSVFSSLNSSAMSRFEPVKAQTLELNTSCSFVQRIGIKYGHTCSNLKFMKRQNKGSENSNRMKSNFLFQS
ncbi:uncharacterized protein LOC131038468 [Cryptomeria japonica]|uniref:uncharacterized protein LOC131038468 n=1 Tax=Cryptomeria japonica TaxID=3369 RepID=UPI0027DA78AE|nr:uncharacterized protein LOC131038468 [Cryptomeria japonica]